MLYYRMKATQSKYSRLLYFHLYQFYKVSVTTIAINSVKDNLQK